MNSLPYNYENFHMPVIRQETDADHHTVYNLVKDAFATAEHSDGTEQDLVAKLHKSPAFVAELSLLAEYNGQAAGYVLLTEVLIGGSIELALAPLAVAPQFQGRGIGGRLINHAHTIAKAMGYHYSVLLGNPDYYRRFGYVPADSFGITAPFDVPDGYFMARPLQKEPKKVQGVVQYDQAFGL